MNPVAATTVLVICFLLYSIGAAMLAYVAIALAMIITITIRDFVRYVVAYLKVHL